MISFPLKQKSFFVKRKKQQSVLVKLLPRQPYKISQVVETTTTIKRQL